MSADGPVAVVTGAAQGLGFASARRLARDGFRVALLDVAEDRLGPAVTQLESVGAAVWSGTCDVRGRSACSHAIRSIENEFGRVEALVNAAGIYPRRPVLDIGADDWQAVFEVNVLGTYFMMVEAIEVMRSRGAGRIVNVTSIDAFKAHPDNAHYAATKAAVVSLTRSLALEVAPLGIVVNSVAPGPMATEAAKRTDWYEPMVAALPSRSPIEPEEVAEVVAYLASSHNRSIVGENIVISGGGVIV